MYHHHLLKHLLQNYPSSSSSSSVTSIRFISSCKNTSKPNQFAINYLINSCGLSPESAYTASKRITFKPSTTKTPDSVLSLFKSHGFTNSHISKLIIARPQLLMKNPDKFIKPKLDFYVSFGITGPVLGKILCADPNYIMSSLRNKIIPFINFLRSIIKTDSGIVQALNRTRWGFFDKQTVIGRNISILQDHGVPEGHISKHLQSQPTKFCVKSDKFNKVVLDVKNMGFSSSSMQFVYALDLCMMKKSTWDAKMAVFQGFGWSEDEVLSLLKKQPAVFNTSVKKLNSALDIFMNTLKWTSADICRNTNILMYSLGKRVIPRLHVLQILLSKDLISKKGIGQALREAEDKFVQKYVIKHQCEVPDLLKVYQNKMNCQSLKIGS